MIKNLFKSKVLTYSAPIILLFIVVYVAGVDFKILNGLTTGHVLILGVLTLGLLLQNAIGVRLTMALFQYRIPFTHTWHIAQFYGLMNYLPLKAGLIGEATHLKVKYKFPVHNFITGTAVIAVLSLAIYMLLVIVSLLFVGSAKVSLIFSEINLTILLLLSAGVALLTIFIFFMPPRLTSSNKYLDYINLLLESRLQLLKSRNVLFLISTLITAGTIIYGLRIWVGIAVLGVPVSFPLAIILGVAANFSFLFSITPAGLGVKEAFLGALTFLFVGDAAVGVAVVLLNRVFDFSLIAILGSLSFMRMRQRGMI